MAESFIEHVGLTLPYELCLMIYSYIFAVDFDVLEKAQAIRKSFQDRGLPPRAVCLEAEAYRAYRQNPERRKHWPDHLEKAFFDGIEHTHTYRPGDAARDVSGIDADFVRILRCRGISVPSGEPGNHNETISDLILALTGVYKNRKQISSHIQVIKSHLTFPESFRSPSGLISTIISLASLEPFAMHDALYRLLHDDAIVIGDDIRALETLSKALTPAFRQAIKKIELSLSADEASRTLRLLHPEHLPGLGMLSVLEWPYRDSSGETPCAKRTYDAADHFLQSLRDMNPGVSIT